MGKVIVVLGTIFLLLLLLAGCASDEVTGSSVADYRTLTVMVQNESADPVAGAKIYVNGKPKATTSRYGAARGSKTVLLEEGENIITVAHSNYADPSPQTVSAVEGEQAITFILRDKTTTYHVDLGLQGVRVSLYYDDFLYATEITGEQGVATFEQVPDGNYTVRVAPEGYQRVAYQEKVDVAAHSEILRHHVLLVEAPRLIVFVQDADNPLEGAEVSVYLWEDFHSPGSYPLSAKLTNNGEAEFKFVEYDQRYVVVVKKQGYLSETEEVLLEPGAAAVEIVLEPIEEPTEELHE